MQNNFILKGDILYSENPRSIKAITDAYLVCEDGKVAGVFNQLPEKYTGLSIKDYSGKIIIPGLVDLHLHAPQYAFRTLGMDLELLDWLNAHTFPNEAKYADIAYAQNAYRIFTDDLVAGPSTRSVMFGTIHTPATLLLMDMLEESKMQTYIGKVNMDRNSPDILREETRQSLADTQNWIETSLSRYKHTKPIITPRFIPSCTDKLMNGLSELQKKYKLPMQSHLSENLSEVDWVHELCPASTSYSSAYYNLGLFGGECCPTIMAHCVHVTEDELVLMKEQQVYIAHCPQSNNNLSSGIAPARKFLEHNLNVGLGTDIAGGFSLSMFRAISDAIQMSKLYWRLIDDKSKPLTLPEAFYLATKGGGSFFGKVGSFEPGYEFDAVVLDDSLLPCPFELTAHQRLERIVYLSDDRQVSAKYAAGHKIK